jgi:muramoyltetrapeptide carboxypeptidase LdcA involved in peptidoglycan recycling
MGEYLTLPPALPDGGTIAVVSPSWGGPAHLPARYQRALTALRELGYNVVVMPHAEGRSDGSHDWVSGSVEERLSDLHSAFADPTIDLVLASIGGNHSAQLIADIDYDLIAANPKPLSGYSDITVLLHAVHQRTGLVTFYGPALLPEFGEIGGPEADVVSNWRRVLSRPEPAGPMPRTSWQQVEFRGTSDDAGRPRQRVDGEPRTILRSGSAEGPLLPGCLPSIRHLIGTPWQPDFAGRILILEPPEAPYDPELADSDLASLRLAGVFDQLAGLAVGRTDGWTPQQATQPHESVLAVSQDHSYPILAGVECTHSAPLMTLPIGVRGAISGDDLVVLDAAVS